MADSERIEIALSKAKLAKLLFFSIVFLGIGLWIIIAEPEIKNSFFNNPFIKALASYGSVLMGALGIYVSGKKMFDDRPGVVIDDSGFIDNTSAFNFGLIPWSDVSEIFERTMQVSAFSKQSFVTIALVDAEKYIMQEKNLLKRKLLTANTNSYGSPIHISTNSLKTEHKDLLEILTKKFEGYKGQASVSNGSGIM